MLDTFFLDASPREIADRITRGRPSDLEIYTRLDFICERLPYAVTDRDYFYRIICTLIFG